MASLSSRGDNSPSASEKRKWCDHESVMDVTVTSACYPPLNPPVPRYLEEVLLGLQGGEADSRIQGDIRRGVESPLAEKVAKLGTLLVGEKSLAVPVCTALFWISIGILFHRMHRNTLQEFRNRLAKSWYLLCLDIQKNMSKDQEARDWALAALPFLFAQAVYRLLVDAFEDDRKHIVGQSEQLLDKLSLMMHFEVTGFQVKDDTVKKARKKLFLRNVLNKPQVDLFASEEAKKRQEMLESQAAATQDKPLSFGQQDGQALEETQLEHVMQGRAANANKLTTPTGSCSGASPRIPTSTTNLSRQRSKSCQSNLWASETRKSMGDRAAPRGSQTIPLAVETDDGMDSPLRVWTPDEDLSVERYDELTGNGLEMYGRHIREFAKILGLQDFSDPVPSTPSVTEEIPEEPFPLPSSPPGRVRVKPGSLSLPTESPTNSPKRITMAGDHVQWPGTPTSRLSVTSVDIPEDDEDSPRGENDEEVAMRVAQNRKLMRKKVRQVTSASMFMRGAKPDKERKEMIAKQKKLRQEAVHRCISEEPLPKELRQHELVTTWVSPVMKCLATEEDRRSVLRKTSAESRQCKMKSLSMPSLMPLRESVGSNTRAASPTGSRASTAPTKAPSPSRADGLRSMTEDSSLGSNRSNRLRAKTAPGGSGFEADAFNSPTRSRFDSELGRPRFDSDMTRTNNETHRGTRFGTEPHGSITNHFPSGMESRAVGGSEELMLHSPSNSGKPLPRLLSAGGTGGSGRHWSACLTLEPPPSLNKVVVVDRLEKQGCAFRQSTFAQYLRENDIFTGDPKVRFDAVRLGQEEQSALDKAKPLEGPAKRRARTQLVKPTKLQSKR